MPTSTIEAPFGPTFEGPKPKQNQFDYISTQLNHKLTTTNSGYVMFIILVLLVVVHYIVVVQV